MMRRRVAAVALLLSTLVGPVGTGIAAAEPERPPAGPQGARMDGRGASVSLSPSGQQVMPGQRVDGVLTVINDTTDVTPETLTVYLYNDSSFPSWYTSYTCPAGWIDLDSGDPKNPKAACKFADEAVGDGKPWPPGSRAEIKVTYEVPADAQPGAVRIFSSGVDFWDPRTNAMSTKYIDIDDFTVVSRAEIPLVDPWILGGAAVALAAVVYARRRQGQDGAGPRIAV
ncbi:hypothetical protein OG897_08225 [Streptomyces sp. NBC_00237]|uniref:hypothetical protein n=1 Tax=Streptomyces sp. NBC_00237 TaxID=2975687 RepID=UPI0022561C45|nr:hypothetical protein [Streptomyces sp. NBC_00237]MCX5201438.1 hypothetical protein [Streptomyces sp. NBC_00237]